MAALRLDQARTGTVSAIVGTGEAQVTPRPGRYEIDTSCSAVTFRTRHLFVEALRQSRARHQIRPQSRHGQLGSQQDIALRRCGLGCGRLTHRSAPPAILRRGRNPS